jgi:hypothetical protein
MLTVLGEQCEALRDTLPENTDDVEVFRKLKERGDVIIISTDYHQRTRQAEARAIKEAGLTVFYFSRFFTKMQFWPQVAWVTKHWPQIRNLAESIKAGHCAEISQNGKASFYQI